MCSVTKPQNKARRIFKTANISIGAIIEYTIQLSIIYKHETMLQNTNSKEQNNLINIYKNTFTLLVWDKNIKKYTFFIKFMIYP